MSDQTSTPLSDAEKAYIDEHIMPAAKAAAYKQIISDLTSKLKMIGLVGAGVAIGAIAHSILTSDAEAEDEDDDSDDSDDD